MIVIDTHNNTRFSPCRINSHAGAVTVGRSAFVKQSGESEDCVVHHLQEADTVLI